MPRKPKITKRCEISAKTDRRNELCSILEYKFKERSGPIIERFEAYVGLPFEWNSMSVINVTKFRDYCYEDMSPNSVATTCAWVASVLRIYCSDKGINCSKQCEVLTVKREMGTFTFVTEEDISALIDYYKRCEDVVDRAVCATAIMEFYTGARKSDVVDMTASNISKMSYIDRYTGLTKLSDMISYTSKKTKIKASVPVKPIVLEILKDTDIDSVDVTTVIMDYRIKRIFKDIGLDRVVHERKAGRERDDKLYNCVSSHTFRRSFATNLDRKGVPIEMTSRMMGHTNTQQTRRYVCGNTLVLDDEAISFFL